MGACTSCCTHQTVVSKYVPTDTTDSVNNTSNSAAVRQHNTAHISNLTNHQPVHTRQNSSIHDNVSNKQHRTELISYSSNTEQNNHAQHAEQAVHNTDAVYNNNNEYAKIDQHSGNTTTEDTEPMFAHIANAIQTKERRQTLLKLQLSTDNLNQYNTAHNNIYTNQHGASRQNSYPHQNLSSQQHRGILKSHSSINEHNMDMAHTDTSVQDSEPLFAHVANAINTIERRQTFLKLQKANTISVHGTALDRRRHSNSITHAIMHSNDTFIDANSQPMNADDKATVNSTIPETDSVLLPGAVDDSTNTTLYKHNKTISIELNDFAVSHLHTRNSVIHIPSTTADVLSTISNRTIPTARSTDNTDVDSNRTEFMTPAKIHKKRKPSLAVSIPKLKFSTDLISPVKTSTMRYSRRVSVMSGHSSDTMNATHRDNVDTERTYRLNNTLTQSMQLSAREQSIAEETDPIDPNKSLKLLCSNIGRQYILSNVHNVFNRLHYNTTNTSTATMTGDIENCLSQLYDKHSDTQIYSILKQVGDMLKLPSLLSQRPSSNNRTICTGLQQYIQLQYKSNDTIKHTHTVLCRLITALLNIEPLNIVCQLLDSDLCITIIAKHYNALLVSIQHNANIATQHIKVLIAMLKYAYKLYSTGAATESNANDSERTMTTHQQQAQHIVTTFEKLHIFEYVVQMIQQCQLSIQTEQTTHKTQQLYNSTGTDIVPVEPSEHSSDDISMNGWSDSESFEDSYIPNEKKFVLNLSLPINGTTNNTVQSAHTATNGTTVHSSILPSNESLHISILQMILLSLLSLSTNNTCHTLNPLYCSDKHNALQLLQTHLNTEQFLSVTQAIQTATADNSSIQRLLRLLCSNLYNASTYTVSKQIGRGRYGTVHIATMHDSTTVAVKQIDMQPSDASVLYNVYNEISIMECLSPCEYVTTILDYGCTETAYYIVMSYSQCSLKQLLHILHADKQHSVETLQLILTLYAQALQAIQQFSATHITHFDIKADNILIDCTVDTHTASITELINSGIHIRICDFGESVQGNTSKLSRGTENIQSPEMLTLMRRTDTMHSTYDRRRLYSNDNASDIWSLGCLLYEMLCNDYLYNDTYELPIYAQVTDNHQPVINDIAQHAIAQWMQPQLATFVQSVLIRDVHRRPNIVEVTRMYDKLFYNGIQCTNNSNAVIG